MENPSCFDMAVQAKMVLFYVNEYFIVSNEYLQSVLSKIPFFFMGINSERCYKSNIIKYDFATLWQLDEVYDHRDPRKRNRMKSKIFNQFRNGSTGQLTKYCSMVRCWSWGALSDNRLIWLCTTSIPGTTTTHLLDSLKTLSLEIGSWDGWEEKATRQLLLLRKIWPRHKKNLAS